jgi:hypothetical protein
MKTSVKNVKTLCIKIMHLQHNYPTELLAAGSILNVLGEHVDKFKSDINIGISSLQDKAKKDFGVDVSNRMAYRVGTKAREMVLGDHKKQYFRIKDYLQTVIEKYPGSSCIVTTVTRPTKDQIEAIKKAQMYDITYTPRFHGLFPMLMLPDKVS